MKLEFSRHIFDKYSNIKFHENPSSGSRVVLRRRADGRTDMMKLIVAFHNFSNAPKKTAFHNSLCCLTLRRLVRSSVHKVAGAVLCVEKRFVTANMITTKL